MPLRGSCQGLSPGSLGVSRSPWPRWQPRKTQVPLACAAGLVAGGSRTLAGVGRLALAPYCLRLGAHFMLGARRGSDTDTRTLPWGQIRGHCRLRKAGPRGASEGLRGGDKVERKGDLNVNRGRGGGGEGLVLDYEGGSDSAFFLHPLPPPPPQSAKPASCATWRPTSTAPCVTCRSIKPGRC